MYLLVFVSSVVALNVVACAKKKKVSEPPQKSSARPNPTPPAAPSTPIEPSAPTVPATPATPTDPTAPTPAATPAKLATPPTPAAPTETKSSACVPQPPEKIKEPENKTCVEKKEMGPQQKEEKIEDKHEERPIKKSEIEKDPDASMKNKSYPEMPNPTRTELSKRKRELEEEKARKIAAGQLQRADEDDTLDRIVSLKTDRSRSRKIKKTEKEEEKDEDKTR